MRVIILAALICCVVSCKDHPETVRIPNGDGDNITKLQNDDEEMNAAIAQAKASFNIFEEAWKKKDTANDMYTVKMRFASGESGEHMWLVDLFSKGDVLYGILSGTPVMVNNIHEGDTVQVNKADLSDWMFVRNGKLQGGYTMRVLYNRMSAEERKDFLQSVDFTIE